MGNTAIRAKGKAAEAGTLIKNGQMRAEGKLKELKGSARQRVNK